MVIGEERGGEGEGGRVRREGGGRGGGEGGRLTQIVSCPGSWRYQSAQLRQQNVCIVLCNNQINIIYSYWILEE